MLSHHDRDALDQIARQLEASDPVLAKMLCASKMPGRSRLARLLLILLSVIGWVLLIIGLAAASPGIAVSGVVALIGAFVLCAVRFLGKHS